MSYNPLKSPHNFRKIGATAITPSDTVNNAIGVKSVFCTGAGNVVVRYGDGTTSVAVPVAANGSLEIGGEAVAIHATNTTATGIIPFYG